MTKTQNELKQEVAERAASLLENGMKIGIGSGSTALFFVESLGRRVASGLKIIGVPTSVQTKQHALKHGIPLSTLDETPELDLTIDGTDEYDAALNLIKGGGGAHLREKIVAQASRQLIIICDSSKAVKTLGAFPLPIEVNRFGLEASKRSILKALEKNQCNPQLSLRKTKDGQDFVTDGGHMILDAACGEIRDAEKLSRELFAIAGVVEHGLFIGLAKKALVAHTTFVQEVLPK